MIEIDENDLPITVAEKLITARKEISDNNILAKSLNKAIGGNGMKDAFTDDELREIADYLNCFCDHQSTKEGQCE